MKKEIEDCLKKSYSYMKNGWIFLHIEGDPYERGFQHGYRLGEELSKIIKTLKFITVFNTGKEFKFFMNAASNMFIPHIDSEFLEEMRGIVAGATAAGFEIPFEGLLAWNGYIELLYYWYPSVFDKSMECKKNNKLDHCSAFIATGDATKDKGIVMGHNTWLDFVLGQYFNVILDIEPSDGQRMFMQSGPGYIQSFTDFFITGAGIIGTETTIKGFDKFKEDGDPEFFRARKAMQYGNSIEQWVQIMQKNNNGGYANSWLLGDINTNEIARFEQGLEFSDLKKLNNGYFTGFNAPEDPQIRNLECSYTEYNDVRGDGARRVRWKQLIEKYYGQIDIKTARLMLEDHYDVYLKQEEHPSSRTLCGHSDVDPYEFGGESGGNAYSPEGALDGKVVSGKLAKDFAFWARFGRSCGEPFYVEKFIKKNPQWSWQKEFLQDRKRQPWTLFSTEE